MAQLFWHELTSKVLVLASLFRLPRITRVVLGRLPVARSGRVSVEVDVVGAGWLRVGTARRFVSDGGAWIFRARPATEVQVVFRSFVGMSTATVRVPQGELPEMRALPVVRVPRITVARQPVALRPAPPQRVRLGGLPSFRRAPRALVRRWHAVGLPRVPELRVVSGGDSLEVAFGTLPLQPVEVSSPAALAALGSTLVDQHLPEKTSP